MHTDTTTDQHNETTIMEHKGGPTLGVLDLPDVLLDTINSYVPYEATTTQIYEQVRAPPLATRHTLNSDFGVITDTQHVLLRALRVVDMPMSSAGTLVSSMKANRPSRKRTNMVCPNFRKKYSRSATKRNS